MGIRQGFLNDDIMLSGGDLIDAVSALEEEFGIEVSDEDYIAIETVGDARDIVMDLLLQKAVET
jgi:acyl carrier protein